MTVKVTKSMLDNKLFQFAITKAGADELISYAYDTEKKEIDNHYLRHFLIGKIGCDELVVGRYCWKESQRTGESYSDMLGSFL